MIARLRSMVGTASLLGLVLIWFLLLRPVSLGGSASWIVIRGSSMLPGLTSGDLVIVQRAGSYRIGDVIAYRVAADDIGAGHVVIHRLVGGDGSTGWDVQGDNNDAPDPWRPTDHDIVGASWLVIPGAGQAIAWIHQPVILASLAAAFVVAFIVWRPSESGARVARKTVPQA